MHIHTHTRAWACVHVHTLPHTFTRTRTRTRTRTHTRTHTYIHTHTHTYTHTYIHTHIIYCTYIHTYIYIYIYISYYIIYIYMHTYTCIHLPHMRACHPRTPTACRCRYILYVYTYLLYVYTYLICAHAIPERPLRVGVDVHLDHTGLCLVERLSLVQWWSLTWFSFVV